MTHPHKSSKNNYKINELRPIHDNVFVTDLDHGVKQTSGGIIVMDDNMSERGIRPRWCRVYAVGPEVDDLHEGDWILVGHGRWTNRIDLEIKGETVHLWRVDYPEHVFLASDSDPRGNIITMPGYF